MNILRKIPLGVYLVLITATIVFAAAGQGVSTWERLTTIATGDLFPITDISDLTVSDDGSHRAITWGNLMAAPGPIGETTPDAGNFTTFTTTSGLTVSGGNVNASGALSAGTVDTSQGSIVINGDNSTSGGIQIWGNSASEDTTVDYWKSEVNGTEFWFGPDTDTNAFIFSSDGTLTLSGGVIVPQSDTAQSIGIWAASADGEYKTTITSDTLTANRTGTFPNYDSAFLASGNVDSGGDLADGSVDADHIADWYAYEVIPIAWMNGGTSEPDTLDTSTRPPYAYRTFDHGGVGDDEVEDLNFVWFVPSDLSGTTVRFRVKYMVTETTVPNSEGVAFGLSGVSLGNNDLTNATKGDVEVVTNTTAAATKFDILLTGWSTDVTITNLLAGEVAELALIRDVSDAADNYEQLIGVIGIEIRYVRDVTR